jgi:hypothetical protein
MRVNQWLADVFLALPSVLTASHVFGSFCLAFCWLCYVFNVRFPLVKAVSRRRKRGEEQPLGAWQRLFYTSLRKKARLDEGGVYLTHLLAFLLLAAATLLHLSLLALCIQGVALAVSVDRLALTVAVGVICLFSLFTQPAATMERRLRWGFHKPGSIVRAVLREVLIVTVLFLWLYDAYFLPALL